MNIVDKSVQVVTKTDGAGIVLNSYIWCSAFLIIAN